MLREPEVLSCCLRKMSEIGWDSKKLLDGMEITEMKNSLTNCYSSYESAPSDGSVNDWYVVSQFLLKYTVKVFAATNCDQGICVSEIGKYANFITIFELSTGCHGNVIWELFENFLREPRATQTEK